MRIFLRKTRVEKRKEGFSYGPPYKVVTSKALLMVVNR